MENVINNTKRVDTNNGSFEMPTQFRHFQVMHFQSPQRCYSAKFSICLVFGSDRVKLTPSQ